jgi:hypothetical protein
MKILNIFVSTLKKDEPILNEVSLLIKHVHTVLKIVFYFY